MNCAIPEDFRSETSLAKESVEFIINLYAKILSSLYKSVEDIRDEQNLGRVSKEKVLLIADLLGISMLDSQFLGSDLRKILMKVPIIHKFRGAETALKATNLLETNIQPFIDYENGEIHVILQINESTDTRLFQNITPAGWKIGYTQVGNINKSQLIYTYVGSSEDIIGYTMLYKPSRKLFDFRCIVPICNKIFQGMLGKRYFIQFFKLCGLVSRRRNMEGN